MNRTNGAYKGYAMRGETYIYFNGQFWIGLFTEVSDGVVVRVGRFTFGTEPSSAELDIWMHQGYQGLIMFEAVNDSIGEFKKVSNMNPKRALRTIRKESKKPKDIRDLPSHQALQATLESHKKESQKNRQMKKRELKQAIFLRKQAKKKKK